MFCADGVEECEALVTVDMLRRADIQVITLGVDGKTVKGAHGINFYADELLENITVDDIKKSQGVILPGGGVGTKTLSNNAAVAEYTLCAYNAGKVTAAICAAPSVLGKLGILQGKKATCYPGFEKYLQGCQYTSQSVTVCDNVITGKGMGCAVSFACAIIEMIKGENASKAVLSEIMYCHE